MDFANLFRHQIGQLYSNVLSQPCFLCGTQTHHMPLCVDCINDLPRLGHSCQRCAIPITHGDICGDCLKQTPIQSRAISLFRYQGTVKTCLTAYKFRQQLALSNLFSNMLCSQLRNHDNLPECIIPIPLHPRKIRWRGFNQSTLIAKQLSQQLGIACLNTALKRTRHTQAQYQLDLKQRQRNVKNAFVWNHAQQPDHIALLDDVMTTGATLQEAAKTLKKAGINHIELWTIARAISHH